MDATTILVGISVGVVSTTEAAVKLHILLDLRPNPLLLYFTLHDVNVLDHLFFEPGAFFVFDRGYLRRFLRIDWNMVHGHQKHRRQWFGIASRSMAN